MRLAAIFLLLFVGACTKDTILFEQITIESHAITDFTSSCNDLHAQMESGTDVIVYTMPFSLHSDDDFQTLSYAEFEEDVSQCGMMVAYFDGLTSWVRQPSPAFDYLIRHSFDGKPPLTLLNDHSEFTFTPPLNPFDSKTLLPYFIDDNRFLIGTRPFGGSTIDIYEADVASRTATKVGTTNTLPSTFYPGSIQYAGGTWILIGYNPLDGEQLAVVTSPDLATWQGPYMLATLPSTEYWIDEISGGGDVMVARAITKDFLTHQFDPPQPVHYVSSDHGQTWTVLSPYLNILHTQVMDSGTIYAVSRVNSGDRGTVSQLAKSSDGGILWTKESPLFYGERISFYDNSNGLAMSHGTLQVTHNGGKSWQLVITSY